MESGLAERAVLFADLAGYGLSTTVVDPRGSNQGQIARLRLGAAGSHFQLRPFA